MDGRIGIGFDIHRLEERLGASLTLGGIKLACDLAVIAHSDGDVILHALCDALLGALGAGDIGERFPDDDPAHRGRDSREFVRAVRALPELAGWRVVNCDCNVIAERPRLGSHKPAIQASLAALLDLPIDGIGVKVRSYEGLDSIGAGRAIAAQVVVLMTSRSSAL